MPQQSPVKALDNINKAATGAEAKIATFLGLIAQPNKAWLKEDVKADLIRRLEMIKTVTENSLSTLRATPVPLEQPAVAAPASPAVEEPVSNGSVHPVAQPALASAASHA
jgi:hypothetical protein